MSQHSPGGKRWRHWPDPDLLRRGAPHPHLEQRVFAKCIGIIRVFIAAGDLIDALRHQIGQSVANVGRMTLIIKSFRHLMGQLNLPVYSTEDQRT